MRLTLLNPKNPQQDFPPISHALKDPDGLMAMGGCLSTTRLINAYRLGIFPWFNAGEPILWWSPNPRLVLFPDKLSVSRSLRKTLRNKDFTVTFDKAFHEVIAACAKPRAGATGTWITSDIEHAYHDLHQLGVAHSVETWFEGKLVGGLYGVALGQVFFGESMFFCKTDASKVAFVTLAEQLKIWNYQLIDCQVHSNHLSSFGAELIEREHFARLLNSCCEQSACELAWRNL